MPGIRIPGRWLRIPSRPLPAIITRQWWSSAPVIIFLLRAFPSGPREGLKRRWGCCRVDEDFAQALLKENPKFQFLPQVFEREHSIEVELPFLQKTFDDMHIVPILMGDPDPQVCRDLAVALDKLIGQRDDVLILITSDMSHYYTYDVANSMDALALQAIKEIDPKKFFEGCMSRKMEMCGFVPVTTALISARLRGIKHVEVLKHANSGDTSGDKSRVVGYSSVIFYSDLLGHKRHPRTRESRH